MVSYISRPVEPSRVEAYQFNPNHFSKLTTSDEVPVWVQRALAAGKLVQAFDDNYVATLALVDAMGSDRLHKPIDNGGWVVSWKPSGKLTRMSDVEFHAMFQPYGGEALPLKQ